VPLDFLKRKKPDDPAPTPEPEDVSAEEFLVRITYAAKSSEGVRMTAGPNALAALPTILFGVAKGEVELVIVVITQLLTTPGVDLVGPLPLELRVTTSTIRAISAVAASRSSFLTW
jgi:hypothetical protein